MYFTIFSQLFGISTAIIIIAFAIQDKAPLSSLSINYQTGIESQWSLSPVVRSAIISSNKAISSWLPKRLMIPAIKVDSSLEQVGLTSQGAVDVPKWPTTAAWFRKGARPGEVGSSVIVGHYGSWKNGQGSVFDNLHTLQQGDIISIMNDEGLVVSFAVREIRTYDANAIVPEIFFSNDGLSHLNLITCQWKWNITDGTYENRLVVFSDKVE